MIKGFLFDWVHILGNQLSIYKRLQDAVLVFTNRADTPFPCLDKAPMAAQIASDLLILQFVV
jgi:hypothetical protein